MSVIAQIPVIAAQRKVWWNAPAAQAAVLSPGLSRPAAQAAGV